MADETELRIIAAFDDAIRGMRQVREEMARTAGAATTASATAATGAAGFVSGFAKASDTMRSVGRNMQGLGRDMTTGLTLPLVAVGGVALKAAIDFESSFAGIRKTTEATEAQFQKLDDAITAMSERIPVSTTELNRIGELGGALGVPIAGMEKFIETVAVLGATTDVSIEEGATAIAQLSNVLGTSVDDVDRFAATLVDLGNKGASTEGQILEMSKRIAGAGSVVGLSEAQVLGFAAGLANMGINAESGGSAISRAFTEAHTAITSGSKESAAALEVWASTSGMSVDQFTQAFQEDASGAMVSFIGGLGNVIDSGGDVVGILDAVGLNSVQARDAFLRAASGGDAFTDAINVATTAWGENTAAQDEAAVRFGTTESQLELMKNEFVNIARELGEALIPFLKDLMGILKSTVIPAIRAAVDWFTKLPGPVQKFIVVGAGLLAILGPILLILGSLVTTVGALLTPLSKIAGLFVKVGGISKFGKALGILKTAFSGIATVIRVAVMGAFNLILAHPIIAAIAAIIAIVILLIKNWDKVGPFFVMVWEWVKDIFGKAIDFLVNLFLNFTPLGLIIQHWDSIVAWFQNLWEGIKTAFSTAIGFLVNLFLNFTPLGLIIQHWQTITGFFSGLWENVKGVISGAIDFLKNVFFNFTPLGLIIQHWQTITGFFSNLWATVTGIISGAVGTIKSVLLGIKSAIDSVIGFFQGLWDRIAGIVSGIVGTIRNAAETAKGWLQSLNPFHRSSPSLVDQVTAGTKVIAAKYAQLGGLIAEGEVAEMPEVAQDRDEIIGKTTPTGKGLPVRLVGIDESVLPIAVSGGGGEGGGAGGLADEIGGEVADAISGERGGGGRVVGPSGVRAIDRAIGAVDGTGDTMQEAWKKSWEERERVLDEETVRNERIARDAARHRGSRFPDPAVRSRNGRGGFRPEVVAGSLFARERAVVDRPVARVPTVKSPKNRRAPTGGDTYVVNNPRPESSEDSLRKNANKRTYLGANGSNRRKPGKRKTPVGPARTSPGEQHGTSGR